MNSRVWWIIGLVIIALLAWWYFRGRAGTPQPGEIPSEEQVQEDQAAERANEFLEERGVTLPSEVERVNLRDVAGGTATGVATRDQINGSTEYTVLAALPELSGGQYEAWLTRVDGSDPVSLGELRAEKGGFIVEKTTTEDWSERTRVMVTSEAQQDMTPETVVLEGSY